ncbi:uncharacterized protein BJ171DRAFT_183040 [Polychytrium aggregatum]|uniref:uncharacterized protein n=1 Tax=Polychytrium aggregatum TaxID=110093 RepID=UPI0022FDB9C7|nr:uncharacterized protein BJ171DRAFT_183040 [Polychytrium aggregatum]KAI9202317.1 hypothetical protein BJ171DRAFT_183040 [Polychytrium aggregatum]
MLTCNPSLAHDELPDSDARSVSDMSSCSIDSARSCSPLDHPVVQLPVLPLHLIASGKLSLSSRSLLQQQQQQQQHRPASRPNRIRPPKPSVFSSPSSSLISSSLKRTRDHRTLHNLDQLKSHPLGPLPFDGHQPNQNHQRPSKLRKNSLSPANLPFPSASDTSPGSSVPSSSLYPHGSSSPYVILPPQEYDSAPRKHCAVCSMDISNYSVHKKSQQHIECLFQVAMDTGLIRERVRKIPSTDGKKAKYFCEDCNMAVTNTTQHCRTEFHKENFCARVDERKPTTLVDKNGAKKMFKIWHQVAPSGYKL